jgi:Rod binding domain-containing protein
VSIGGSLSSSITSSAGYTDYIVAQLRTTTAVNAGDTSLCTMSLSYLET